MSLVYLITSLPLMRPGTPPPLPREELVKKARAALEGADREELELALLLEEIEETCRLMAEAHASVPGGDVSSSELTTILRTKRRPTPGGPTPSELPDWVMMPLPQHVLHRRWHHVLYERATSGFLKGYAQFSVDLQEVLTALLARREHMPKEQFLAQMEGHFDSTAEVLVRKAGDEELGVEKRHAWFPRVKAALELGSGATRDGGAPASGFARGGEGAALEGHSDLVEMERALDRLRWEEYERMRGLDPFSIDTLLVFYFQLRILEREASWDAAEGERRLEAALALPRGLGMEQSQL